MSIDDFPPEEILEQMSDEEREKFISDWRWRDAMSSTQMFGYFMIGSTIMLTIVCGTIYIITNIF